VAFFNDCNSGSAFHRVLTSLPTWPRGSPSIFARQQMRGMEEKVASVAKILKREGEVQDWRPNYISGKIEVLLLRGYWRVFPTRQSILRLASSNVSRMVLALDQERKKAKNPKKRLFARN
jgi:hypothetical protein